MHIIFLRFGPKRTEAGLWMAEHVQWIQQGIDEGVFLVAGSLDNAQGGVVVAANMESAQVQRRVAQDPFVIHGVVTAEVHAVAPSLLVRGMAALLDNAKPFPAAP